MNTKEARAAILDDARDRGVTNVHRAQWIAGTERGQARGDLAALRKSGLLEPRGVGLVPSSLCNHLPPVDQAALHALRLLAASRSDVYAYPEQP